MHTVYVIAGGLLLLVVLLLLGRVVAGDRRPTLARLVLGFIPLWLASAAVNFWVGVTRAGYGVREELPVFLVVFGVPALVAWGLWRPLVRR